MKLINFIRWAISLKKTEFRFIDLVDGRHVYSFIDCNGDRWLSHSKFECIFSFRVKQEV